MANPNIFDVPPRAVEVERSTWETHPQVMVDTYASLVDKLNEANRIIQTLWNMKVEVSVARTDNSLYVSERKLRS